MNENQGRPDTLSGTQERRPETSTGVVEKYPSPWVPPKARRSGRVKKEIPILLIGSDADGWVFTEETHTVVLSLHGRKAAMRPTGLRTQRYRRARRSGPRMR